jgi:uncharacterized protein YegL
VKKKSFNRNASKKKTSPTSSRRKTKKSFLFWQRGEIALYLLLGIIIFGAFLLASGGPQFKLSESGEEAIGEPIRENSTQKDALQLKTIRFAACSNRAAVDFLVDTSGSMEKGNKIQIIKSALMDFAGNFTNDSITGLRRYSSNDTGTTATSRPVGIDFYKNNKTQFNTAVSRLVASGGTNTRTAFAAELEDLTQAVTDPKFKDNSFNLVFISDGIPEGKAFPPSSGDCQEHVSPEFPVCAPYNQDRNVCRCFDSNQDPTFNPQIAQQIQALKNINGKNIRIFSILVFDPATDGPFESKLTTMMQAIASPNSFYKTTKPEDIKSIYGQIADKICEETGGGTNITPTP